MIEIIFYATLGSVLSLLASCAWHGIRTWLRHRRNRREMARRLRQPGWAFLPPALPTSNKVQPVRPFPEPPKRPRKTTCLERYQEEEDKEEEARKEFLARIFKKD